MSAERTEEQADGLARAHAIKPYIRALKENPVWQAFQADLARMSSLSQHAHENLASTPAERAEHLRPLLLLRDTLRLWLERYERDNQDYIERNKIKASA